MGIPGKFLTQTGMPALSLLGCFTAWRHDWIESALGVDPDSGSGLFEWALVILPAMIAAAVLVAYRKRNAGRVTGQGGD